MKEKNDFEFKYSAPTNEEKKEIESIRNSYIPKSNQIDKLAYLRKLDSKVKNTPTIVALVFGIVGILIFGLGLTMILEWHVYIWGVIVGVLGLVPTCLALPMHNKTLKYLKDKYSQEIIKLSDELLDNNKK